MKCQKCHDKRSECATKLFQGLWHYVPWGKTLFTRVGTEKIMSGEGHKWFQFIITENNVFALLKQAQLYHYCPQSVRQ
jgi:hypothetical protein